MFVTLFFLLIVHPPGSSLLFSSEASEVYKGQASFLRRNVPNLAQLLEYDFVDTLREGRVRVRLDARYGFLDSLGTPLLTGPRPP